MKLLIQVDLFFSRLEERVKFMDILMALGWNMLRSSMLGVSNLSIDFMEPANPLMGI
jgi:hypothetical protein